MARLKSLPKQVARMAKENGGDAVIVVSSENDVIGYASNASAAVNGYAAYGNRMSVPFHLRSAMRGAKLDMCDNQMKYGNRPLEDEK